jgi:hypothetical protein
VQRFQKTRAKRETSLDIPAARSTVLVMLAECCPILVRSEIWHPDLGPHHPAGGVDTGASVCMGGKRVDVCVRVCAGGGGGKCRYDKCERSKVVVFWLPYALKYTLVVY